MKKLRLSAFAFLIGLLANHAAFAANDVPRRIVHVFGQFTGKPKTTEFVDGHEARCLTLDKTNLKMCGFFRQVEDGQFELRLFRGKETFGQLLVAYSVSTNIGSFDVGFTDMNGDGQKDIVLVTDLHSGNGIVIAEQGVAVFIKQKDSYKLADYLLVSGLSEGYAGFYKKGKTLYLEEANWTYSSHIHPERELPGTYLATNWYRWDKNKFTHDTTLPTVTRRLTENFWKDGQAFFKIHKRRVDSESPPYEPGFDQPYPWFLSSRTRTFDAKIFLDKYADYDENKGFYREPARDPVSIGCATQDYRKEKMADFTPCQ